MSRVGTVELVSALSGPHTGVPSGHPHDAGEATGPAHLMDDAQLIPLAAKGDRAAFQVLVERHRMLVYRVAYQYAGNHHDADDIAQEVFLKVFRSLDRFRQDSQFTSWLYRIALNACVDHSRRRNPADPTEDSAELLIASPATDPDPEVRAYGCELGDVVRAAVDRLPPRQRLIFTMRHFEDLKLIEIAKALGLAEGTVKRQLHAAVHRLRRLLRDARVAEGGQPA
jgi:RNA polymerase sigma-70 factor (ECF subfamily)